MLVRLGLILLVVLFGACCFAAGMLAPDAWKTRLGLTGDDAFGRPSESVPKMHPAPSSTATSKPATTSTVPPTATTALLVATEVAQPAPAPGQPGYALQLGQYASGTDAEAAMRRGARAMPGLALDRFDTVDAARRTWTVVALGRYVSADAARQAAPRLQAVLGVVDLPVIRLPERTPLAR
ncbi:MAG: SPOR domain-containing protein [Luteibacter sp.]